MEYYSKVQISQTFECSYPSVPTDVLGAHKNCLIEMIILSTHNNMFFWEIRKLFVKYTFLSRFKSLLLIKRGYRGSTVVQLVECWTCVQEVAGLNPTGNSVLCHGAIFIAKY